MSTAPIETADRPAARAKLTGAHVRLMDALAALVWTWLAAVSKSFARRKHCGCR